MFWQLIDKSETNWFDIATFYDIATKSLSQRILLGAIHVNSGALIILADIFVLSCWTRWHQTPPLPRYTQQDVWVVETMQSIYVLIRHLCPNYIIWYIVVPTISRWDTVKQIKEYVLQMKTAHVWNSTKQCSYNYIVCLCLLISQFQSAT